jgi:DNA-directed RNA polymerase specialized sigma24 family protein
MDSSVFLEHYYANEGSRLHKMVNSILRKFPSVCQKDCDDFYSLANEVFSDVLKRYDGEQSFDGFLYSCISNKVKTEMTRRNRKKRKPEKGKEEISIETPIGNDGFTVSDTIVSDFDLDCEIYSNDFGFQFKDEKIEKFYNNLSDKQKKLLQYKINGLEASIIKEKMNLTDNQYNKLWEQIKSFENTYELYANNNGLQEEEEENMGSVQTLEKSKPDKLSVASIMKKIDSYTIRFDHPLQRESGQWSPAMKGNLISDMLQGNPIPSLVFAEQVLNGLAIIWDLDGKQRCTNIHSFINDGYKISRNIRRWDIHYQAQLKDEVGKFILDANGFPQSELRSFDIRSKKFSDLPEELQDKIKDYNFEIVQYLNCSNEDIAYHIARYNEGKPMNASQKGITRLGEEFASHVKSISNMEFFKDLGGYKVSEATNGTINRVVVESVMASNFVENWKKKQEDMCEFMKDNATVEQFDNFEDMVLRLTKVGNEEVFNMFDSRDSFIWFGLFARFVKSELDDERFVEFMAEFTQSLHITKLNNISYDDLNNKSNSTKDKKIVIDKLNLLESLMNSFLHIEEETQEDLHIESEELKKYIVDFNNSDLTKVCSVKGSDKTTIAMQSLMMVCGVDKLSDADITNFVDSNKFTSDNIDDTLLYLASLDQWTLDVDSESAILSAGNIPALVSVVKYVYDNDLNEEDCIDWFVKLSKSSYAGQAYVSKVEMLNKLIGSLKHHIDKANEKIA